MAQSNRTMNTRKTRNKRARLNDEDFVLDLDDASISPQGYDRNEADEARRSRIRDSNKEFARRMTILESWSDYWNDYTTRQGEAYPRNEARMIIKRSKKITCPIASCGKAFTSYGGLKYHYARCNIQRSFTCKVCKPPIQLVTRGELLRHLILSHYDDLPPLNDEQKEIANSYLSYEPRCDKVKRDRRTTGDTEALANVTGLLKNYKDLLDNVFLGESYCERPYRDWLSSTRHWEPQLFESERRRFYPPEQESVPFKLDSEESEEWTRLQAGESRILMRDKREQPSSIIFFTGGINTATAWLPKCYYNHLSSASSELIAIAVSCCSMDKTFTYSETHETENCIQFWSMSSSVFDRTNDNSTQVTNGNSSDSLVTLSYMIGHNYGTIFDMSWCPLGASWQVPGNNGDVFSRCGLLALACGDGHIRILSIPHTASLLARVTDRVHSFPLEGKPIFKAQPVAVLIAPGVGPTNDYMTNACKSISWNAEDQQKLIVAGYTNGTVALYDLCNKSPVLYAQSDDCHTFQPLKSWIAHGGPVSGVAVCSKNLDSTFIATGSVDRQLKIWNAMDLSSCISSDRAPITKVLWDFRFRGIISATDTAFTSFQNRVSYKYPVADGSHNVTVSNHRSTVWAMSSSIITGAVATGDLAGELFVMPQMINRSLHKRDKNLLCSHSIFTMLPQKIEQTTTNNELAVNSTEPLSVCQNTENQISLVEGASITDANGLELDLKKELGVPSKSKKNKIDEQSDDDENPPLVAELDFSTVERPIANKPDKFLLPMEMDAIETFTDFKSKFGLKFVQYNTQADPRSGSKLPESCIRASDSKNIYCDRPCDYPFSSINLVTWSPNLDSFPFLLSATQIGLCRLDKIQIVDQIYKGHVETQFQGHLIHNVNPVVELPQQATTLQNLPTTDLPINDKQ